MTCSTHGYVYLYARKTMLAKSVSTSPHMFSFQVDFRYKVFCVFMLFDDCRVLQTIWFYMIKLAFEK